MYVFIADNSQPGPPLESPDISNFRPCITSARSDYFVTSRFRSFVVYFTRFILCKAEIFCDDSKSYVEVGMGLTKQVLLQRFTMMTSWFSSSLFIGKGVGLGFPFMEKKDHLSPATFYDQN